MQPDFTQQIISTLENGHFSYKNKNKSIRRLLILHSSAIISISYM